MVIIDISQKQSFLINLLFVLVFAAVVDDLYIYSMSNMCEWLKLLVREHGLSNSTRKGPAR